jgi:Zn-dependent peptidase ImmA (M78 family)
VRGNRAFLERTSLLPVRSVHTVPPRTAGTDPLKTELQPKVLRWARSRCGLNVESLAKKVHVSPDKVEEWERTGNLSFSEAERLAHATHTPIGFLFLPEPPVEALPVPDFRKLPGNLRAKPSPELIDVLHRCQRRQEWYREYLLENQARPLAFAGKVKISTPVDETARDIRTTIGIGGAINFRAKTWEDAMRLSVEATENVGILVIRTGVAEGNTSRKLKVGEFRGFALADAYAPLVFINGADAPTAQMFTLVHEIAHIWLGESAVSNLEKTYAPEHDVERYCNAVAGEVLVPLETLSSIWDRDRELEAHLAELSRKFKVSKLVVARRARDAGFLSKEQYEAIYLRESRRKSENGGNYYLNEQYLNSRRFSQALIRDTKAGRTLYRDAMRLLGIKKEQTFEKYAASIIGGL